MFWTLWIAGTVNVVVFACTGGVANLGAGLFLCALAPWVAGGREDE